MKSSDNPAPSYLLVEQGSTPTSPSAGNQRLFIKTSDHLLYQVNSAGTVTPVATSGVSLSNASAHLSVDVTMTTFNTYYDGPTVSLAAGTWLLMASLSFTNASLAFFTAKLWDGTTVAASGNANCSAGGTTSISLVGIVTPGGTTTYKVSAACSQASGTMYATAPTNAAGATAATVVAVKIA